MNSQKSIHLYLHLFLTMLKIGAFTFGVVLPSFMIILIIAAFLSDVRPCIVAMILATAIITAILHITFMQQTRDSYFRMSLVFIYPLFLYTITFSYPASINNAAAKVL